MLRNGSECTRATGASSSSHSSRRSVTARIARGLAHVEVGVTSRTSSPSLSVSSSSGPSASRSGGISQPPRPAARGGAGALPGVRGGADASCCCAARTRS